jgi:hypothetical protein
MMNVKNLVLGIGIVIVFGLALGYGIEAFHPSPQYEDYCDPLRGYEVIDNSTICEQDGGKWFGNEPIVKGEVTVKGYCDYDFTCRGEYESTRERYSWSVFLISIIVGIITLLLGFMVLKVEPVGSALIGSAIWAILYGSIWNWNNFGKSWKFILLFIALVLLILIAYRLNKGDKGKKEKKE